VHVVLVVAKDSILRRSLCDETQKWPHMIFYECSKVPTMRYSEDPTLTFVSSLDRVRVKKQPGAAHPKLTSRPENLVSKSLHRIVVFHVGIRNRTDVRYELEILSNCGTDVWATSSAAVTLVGKIGTGLRERHGNYRLPLGSYPITSSVPFKLANKLTKLGGSQMSSE
jgi:hypothetical protein